jgi:hypothetical protein
MVQLLFVAFCFVHVALGASQIGSCGHDDTTSFETHHHHIAQPLTGFSALQTDTSQGVDELRNTLDSSDRLQDASAWSPEVDILYVGGHKQGGQTRTAYDPKGRRYAARQAKRSDWVKMVRCKDGSAESCEDCSAGDDTCWKDDGEDKTSMSIDVDSNWFHPGGRSLFIIHVQCTVEKLSTYLRVKELDQGTLRVFWDGYELNTREPLPGFQVKPYARWERNFTTKKSYMAYSLVSPVSNLNDGAKSIGRLVDGRWPMGDVLRGTAYPGAQINGEPTVSEGAHEYIVEFIPAVTTGKRRASVYIFFNANTDYQKCEDSKACLKVFADKDGEWIRGGKEFRNDNTAQIRCLDGNLSVAQMAEPCRLWLECLEKDDHEKQAIKLLLGATASNSKAVTSQRANHIEKATEEPYCINPLVEDPESWACDCYENMKNRCDSIKATDVDNQSYDEQACFQAIFCSDHRVCAWWKAAACQEERVTKIVGKLVETDAALYERQHAELMRRRGSSSSNGSGALVGNHSNELDRTTGTKSCM